MRNRFYLVIFLAIRDCKARTEQRQMCGSANVQIRKSQNYIASHGLSWKNKPEAVIAKRGIAMEIEI